MQWSTLQQLQQQLQSANAETRRQAAEQLGQCKDERAVEVLIVAFTGGERDILVRHTVAESLAQIADARAVPALVELLQHHEDDFVRADAAGILGAIGDARTVEPLVRALQEDMGIEGVWVRWAAARALGAIGDAGAVEALIAHLEGGDKWEVLCEVAEALGEIGDARAVVPLVSALNHWEDVVQRQAAWALGDIGDPRAVEPLVKALKETTHDHVRQAAAWALGKIGDARAVEPLVSALQEATSAAQQTAATALGIIGDIGAVESLLEALHDWQVQWAARRATPTIPLGGSGDDGEDEGVWRRAASRLPSLQDIGDVIERWTHESAALSLVHLQFCPGPLGDVQAVLPLVRVLNDVEGVVRSAAWALGKLGDAQAVDRLITALARNEKSEALRGAVAQALGRIGDPRVAALGRALEEDAGLRHTGFLGHGPAVALVGALEENAEQEALRVVTVAEALGRIGDARAIEPLVSALQDKDGRVRQAAAEALTTLGWQLREDTSPPP